MKKILIGIARFIVNQNDLVATGGAIYACLKIGGEMLGEVMDPLSVIFVILVLRLFYPLIHLVAGIIAKVLKTAAVLYLGHCGQSAGTDYEDYDFDEQGYGGSGQNSQNWNSSKTENESKGGEAGQTASDYDVALKYFGLQTPFTEDQLKAKHRKFMKTAHPDVGGSTEDAKRINYYYDVLKQYAA